VKCAETEPETPSRLADD